MILLSKTSSDTRESWKEEMKNLRHQYQLRVRRCQLHKDPRRCYLKLPNPQQLQRLQQIVKNRYHQRLKVKTRRNFPCIKCSCKKLRHNLGPNILVLVHWSYKITKEHTGLLFHHKRKSNGVTMTTITKSSLNPSYHLHLSEKLTNLSALRLHHILRSFQIQKSHNHQNKRRCQVTTFSTGKLL